MRINPVFHVGLLEPAPDDEPAEEGITVQEIEPEYEVERIVKHQTTEDGESLYLVKWKNFDDAENTWEPLENLENAKQKIKQFQTKHHLERKRKK
jgi:hypothetical protein